MKTMRFPLVKSLAAAAGLALAGAAFAAGPLPPVEHQGDVAYLSGGVGEHQAAAFKAAARDWPLTIELVAQPAKGHHELYTAGADVKVLDRHGKTMLDTKADGPFVLVKLPKGEYRVEASLNGHAAKPRTVEIGGKPERVAIAFPHEAA